jgi:hypothetical protein
MATLRMDADAHKLYSILLFVIVKKKLRCKKNLMSLLNKNSALISKMLGRFPANRTDPTYSLIFCADLSYIWPYRLRIVSCYLVFSADFS